MVKNAVEPIKTDKKHPTKLSSEEDITPTMFIRGILVNAFKTFQSQRNVPAFKRTIHQYNMMRDVHIARIDIIRGILAGRAILANGEIEWKHPQVLQKYNPEDVYLRDPTNWIIRTHKELGRQFIKNSDIHVTVVKSQLKQGFRTPY